MSARIPLAILGASGTVGQKALACLSLDPRYEVRELVASPKNVGKRFSEAVEWREQRALPDEWAKLDLLSPDDIRSPYVLSALPASVASEIEPGLLARGIHVFSNASNARMDAQVPLLVPEINLASLELLDSQDQSGKCVKNPNCAAVGIVLALAPLLDLGGVEHVSVVTLQSISGAGFRGVGADEISDNVIPTIVGEEEKIQQEVLRIVGPPHAAAAFPFTVQVHRVPVLHGHMATLHLRFDQDVSVDSVWTALSKQQALYPSMYSLYRDARAPQPRRHLHPYDQRVHIGQIKQGGDSRTVSLVALIHNLVRGAAGASLLNLEAFLKWQAAR